MNKVIVAGSIITDMSVIVNKHPSIGETVLGNNLSYSPGGKGANQAVSAKRLGANVKLIGKVGKNAYTADANGLMCLEFLRNESIDCSGVSYTEKAPTGVAMIVVSEKTADNNIVVITGANDFLSINDIEFEFDSLQLEEGDVLISQFETPLEATRRFFEIGREKKLINILNPAPAQKISADILDLVDILIVNETELEAITYRKINKDNFREDIIGMAHSMQYERNYDKLIIVTLGEKGVMGFIGTSVLTVDSNKVNAIDTTGAGDCFVGAIAAFVAVRHIRNEEIFTEALKFANDAASVSVTRKGSGISMPYNLEVGAFFSQKKK